VAGSINTRINTREVIMERSQPFLERGEVVAHVVKALEGPPRWVAMLAAAVIGVGVSIVILVPFLGFPLFVLVYTAAYQRRVILATDQALVLLGAGRFRFTPKKVLARLDIETPIGPVQGLFLRTEVDGRRLYITSRTVAEAKAADDDIES
jgi:hypothetical protein